MMPLSMARPGEVGLIKRITGRDETKRHLANLGFTEGSSVLVVSVLSGNMIVNVRNSRVAIDNAMASRIMI